MCIVLSYNPFNPYNLQLFLDDARLKNFITCFKGDSSCVYDSPPACLRHSISYVSSSLLHFVIMCEYIATCITVFGAQLFLSLEYSPTIIYRQEVPSILLSENKEEFNRLL